MISSQDYAGSTDNKLEPKLFRKFETENETEKNSLSQNGTFINNAKEKRTSWRQLKIK